VGIDADAFETKDKYTLVPRAIGLQRGKDFSLSSGYREKQGWNVLCKQTTQNGLDFESSRPIRFPLNNFKFFELSFQSSLQLSLAVLVFYRSFVGIFSLGWSLPPVLGLHSQTTRLLERSFPFPLSLPEENEGKREKCNTIPPLRFKTTSVKKSGNFKKRIF